MTAANRFSLRILAAVILTSLVFAALPARPVYAYDCAWTGANGSAWSDASNWTGCGGSIPRTTDTVTIPDAAATPNDPTLTAVETIDGLTIESGGILNDGGKSLIVIGTSVTLDGTWLGTGWLNLNNAGTITVNGAGSMGSGTRLALIAGSVVFPATANLTFDRIDARGTGLAATNNGTVTVTAGAMTHSASSTATWTNAAASALILNTGTTNPAVSAGWTSIVNDGALTLNGGGSVSSIVNNAAGTLNIGYTSQPSITALNLSAAGNTVVYNRAGAQTINAAVTYSNFATSGSGTKTANGAMTISNDFTVGGGTAFTTPNSVSIAGNLTADGTFTQTAGTTTFTGGGTHTFAGNGVIQFNNLTTSSQTVNAGASDLRIFDDWTHGTAGAFNAQTSTVTFNGTSYQSLPNPAYAPSFYNLTINKSSGGMTTGRTWTVTNNFVLTLGTIEPAGNSSFKNVTLDGGTFTAPGGNINVSGDWTQNASAFNAGSGTVVFNGASQQTLGGSAATTFNNLTLNNAAGLALSAVNPTVNGVFTFTNGLVATGANSLILGTGGSISGAGAGKYVYGNLQKNFNSGAGQTFTFPVGDAANYAPAQLSAFNVSSAGSLAASTTKARHPEFMSANIGDKYVERYWTLAPAGGLAASGYDLTVTFAAGDLVGSPNTGALVMQKYSGGVWSNPSASSSTSTTVTGSGFTSFSDFFTGESGIPTPVTLSYFQAIRSGGAVLFTWSTSTETGNVGFNLYGGGQKLNEEPIPSNATDSLERQDYGYEAQTDADEFYIEDVSINNETRRHGPFEIGEEFGTRLEADKVDWASITSASRPQANFASVNAADALTLRVRETGLYRVDYEQMRAAGLDLNGVPSADLVLTMNGKAQPIYVSTMANFGPGEYIEFYGRALDTLYTDTNVYTLKAQKGKWPRIAVKLAAIPKGAKPAATYRETATVNNQKGYANYAPGADAWYDTSMLAYTTPKSWDFQFSVDGAANLAKPSALALTVWGVTNWPQSPDHRLQVSVNGAPIADVTFDGLSEQVIKATLPGGLLRAGENTLTLTLPADTGVKWDMVNFDKLSVTYARKFAARDGRLTFTAAGRVFRVTNLPSKEATVYQMVNNRLARLNNVKVKADGDKFIVTFGNTVAGDKSRAYTYFVVTRDGLKTPEISSALAAADLDQAADYLIVSHPDFIAGIQPLVQARQAQGYRVSVVNVNDLYNRYTYGVFDPKAIQRYIAYAARELGTKYVLLVGGDTYDYRHYLKDKNGNPVASVSFIPSLYTQTSPIARLVPVDPLYADVDGDKIPDLAIGRFPVRTAAELDTLVAKTLAYQNKDYDATALFVSDVVDGSLNFKRANLDMAAGLNGWTVNAVHLEDYYGRNAQNKLILNVAAARTDLLNAMNAGAALVAYSGHSSMDRWTFSGLFTLADARALTNAGRPFVAVQWGCWNTYYVDPVYNGLTQGLLLSGDRGAAALLGASTLTDGEAERQFGLLLTPRLAAPGMTIGDALRLAKLDLAKTRPGWLDVLLGWNLMGDPALVIRP